MTLPKLSVPEYELTLPIKNTRVKYRPFLVREEKHLYLAMESQDEKEMVNAVKTIIKSCTNLKTKVEELATFEIEYLFLKIRSKAVGEFSEFMVTCPDDNETKIEVRVPLEEIELQIPEGHTNKIQLDDKIGVVMKYPSIDVFISNNLKDNPKMDDIFELAATCIENVYDDEQVYDSFTKKEAIEFIESMDSEQFQLIQKFFESMPKLSYTLKVTNPKTEVESEVVLEGLAAFFG